MSLPLFDAVNVPVVSAAPGSGTDRAAVDRKAAA
jgi:hypothetical protein